MCCVNVQRSSLFGVVVYVLNRAMCQVNTVRSTKLWRWDAFFSGQWSSYLTLLQGLLIPCFDLFYFALKSRASPQQHVYFHYTLSDIHQIIIVRAVEKRCFTVFCNSRIHWSFHMEVWEAPSNTPTHFSTAKYMQWLSSQNVGIDK